MDGLAKKVLKIDTGITLMINDTVGVEVYRCVNFSFTKNIAYFHRSISTDAFSYHHLPDAIDKYFSSLSKKTCKAP